MTATIYGPKELTVPSILGGDDQVYGLVLIAVTRGLFVEELGSGQVRLAGLKDFDLVTPDIVSLLVSKGAEVVGYPVFLEVSPEDELPEGIPGRTYVAEDETEHVRTWSEWKPTTHQFIERDGRTFLEAVYNEEYLPASIWVPLAESQELIVLSRPEFQQLSSEA